jgi:protein TonB
MLQSCWKAMPIGVSCLLHAGLITGVVLGQHWLVTAAPPVLPVQLVTLETAEPAPEPPAPQPRQRPAPPRRIERPRPQEPPAPAKLEQPARVEPQPQPVALQPTPAPAPAPVDVAPGPVAVASLPAISEPAPAPPSSAPAAGGPTVTLGTSGPEPVATAKATDRSESITRTARPQGGYQVRPAYPSAPRRLGIQGTTLLRVHVLADGRIGDVQVERSAGHPDLDQAAQEAVRRWRFEPARRGEGPVAMWVLLPFEFRLTH